MKQLQISTFKLFLLTILFYGLWAHGSTDTDRKAYIVYMGDAPKIKIGAADQHHQLLSSVIGDEDIAKESRIQSHTKSFNAFSAYLLPEEAEQLKENSNVVSVFPSTIRKLHTTRSWDFLSMPLSVNRNPQIESDVIVGMIDTGIYIDAPSFDDRGFGPPPAKWKGSCQIAGNFSGCNNKVIGARAYDKDRNNPHPNPSPADDEGHGTHTSSTVAGVPVAGASLYGLGEGTARGGVPSARLAMYKACWEGGCSDLNLMAAFDDAIADGVDILSVSIGGPLGEYFVDPIAIGSFHAMQKGILTSCSAGNDGPFMGSVENVSPWIMTVAASGMDRQFRTPVRAGNGMKISGISINTFTPKKRMYPLTSGSKAAINASEIQYASQCDHRSMDGSKIKGKIVLCNGGGYQDWIIKELGGVGTVMSLQRDIDTGFLFAIPATCIDDVDGQKLHKYINSDENPTAVIGKSITAKADAPFVASFSSRGPNTVSATILKPDIAAPGVDILAAYSKLVSVTGASTDNRFDVYNILSGTSMACPHATAVAAYVKTFHPDWSPAAIKSALMTTATEMKIKDEMAEFGYGAGQINPTRALSPGLVYDISTTDYASFLCQQGYAGTAVRMVTGKDTDCSTIPNFGGHDALNYPSMHLQLENSSSVPSATFHRVVTNVGPGNSVYRATVKAPKGLKVTIVPSKLSFSKVHEKKAFKVRVKGQPLEGDTLKSASIEWSSSSHKVRSPILLYVPIYMF